MKTNSANLSFCTVNCCAHMLLTSSCLIQVLMQISKRVHVKSTAVYDALLREGGTGSDNATP